MKKALLENGSNILEEEKVKEINEDTKNYNHSIKIDLYFYLKYEPGRYYLLKLHNLIESCLYKEKDNMKKDKMKSMIKYLK